MSDEKTGTNPAFDGEPPQEATAEKPPRYQVGGTITTDGPTGRHEVPFASRFAQPGECAAVLPNGHLCRIAATTKDRQGAPLCEDCAGRLAREAEADTGGE